MATLRSQCRQLQLASGHPTAALRPRAGRPVTPSRARRKSLEQRPSPSIAPSSPCAAPRGTAAAAAAEPGGATAAASAAPEAAAEGLAQGAGLTQGAGRPLGAPASTSAPTSTSTSTSTSASTSTPTPTPTSCPSTAASTVRELELRLERATASTAGLALLWAVQRYPQLQAMPGAGGAQLAEAWSRAMPGAADALQALQGPQQEQRGRAERDAQAVCYLRLLWHARPPAAPAAGAAAVAGAAGRAGGGEAASSAAAWERRLLRHLSSSASH